MMSDSESDTPNSVFGIPKYNTTVCAKGPNINLSNISLRSNNMLTSTMNKPWNFERSGYSESVYEPRQMYSRRDTSPPMSLHSASGMYSRHYNQSIYSRAMSSQRSMINGRSGSPMSVRTIDSNASFSAVDIATAFKTMHFNKYDLRIIKDAYNKHLKMRLRKKVEKRRNLKLFLKGSRRRSGGDSGDQGSDSSSSSNDGRSTRSYRSSVFKDNSSTRSTRAEFLDIRRNIQDSNMYRDCTNSLKQNSFRNVLSVSSHSTTQNSLHKPHTETAKPQRDTSMSQKERFTNGFQLPSQRFNHSLQTICEKTKSGVHNKTATSHSTGIHQRLRQNNEIDSEEEIFSEMNPKDKTTHNDNRMQSKRIPDDEDSAMSSEKKRMKLSSPKKRVGKCKPPPPILNRSLPRNDSRPNDFVFVKPQLPIRKPSVTKKQPVPKSQNTVNKVTSNLNNSSLSKSNVNIDITEAKSKEKVNPNEQSKDVINSHALQPVNKPVYTPQTGEVLLARSKEPTEDVISQSHPIEQILAKSSQPLDIRKSSDSQDNEPLEQSETNNMSMRPSFMKRKLFSQKVDVMDNKNVSSDSLESPQSNVYSVIQKEKNKARKLVTSQSCLNSDALTDENNLLDLIHKIVPANRLNVTTATNTQAEVHSNKSKPANSFKDLDINLVLSSCNNTDDLSETYTDEEIFKSNETKKKKVVNKLDSKEKTPNKQGINKTGVADTPDVQEKNKSITKKSETQKTNKNVAKVGKTRKHEFNNKDSKENLPNEDEKKTQKNTKNNNLAKKSVSHKNNKKTPNKNNINNKENINIQCDINKNVQIEDKAPEPKTQTVTNKSKINVDHRNVSNCKVVLTNMKNITHQSLYLNEPDSAEKINGRDKNLYQCVKSFWDDDLESDVETQRTPQNNINPRFVTVQSNIRNNAVNEERKEKKIEEDGKVEEDIILPHKDIAIHEMKDTTGKAKDKETNKSKVDKLNGTMTKNNGMLANAKKTNNVKTTKVQKVINSTLRVRQPRTPKTKTCCNQPQKQYKSPNKSTDTIYRCLRTRNIDLSSSFKSDDSPMQKAKTISKPKVSAAKNKKVTALKKARNLNSDSDVSFTLTSGNIIQNVSLIRTRRQKYFDTTGSNNDSDLKDLSISRPRRGRGKV